MTDQIVIIRETDKQASEKSLEVCLHEQTVRDQSKAARELFTSLQNELDAIEDLKDGLSYLDMKNDTLLSYMIDLCNIVLRKVRGDTISDHPSVERTVCYRIILEKIKMIDQRLTYQLNKVITMPEGAEENDQGVNVNNLDIDIGSGDDGSGPGEDHDDSEDQEDDDDEDSEFDGSVNEDEDDEIDDDEIDEEDGDDIGKHDEPHRRPSKIITNQVKSVKSSDHNKKSVGVYKPPKLRSVAYSDHRESKTSGRGGRDYRDIYQDDDDGVQDFESFVDRDNERTRYEEENYTRLPDVNPKKAKRKAKEMASRGKKKFKGGKGKKKGGNKWKG